MAINFGGEEAEAMSDINVTPLVDVMLVLLIIFIITIRVILQQVPLALPKATNLVTQTRPENVTIAACYPRAVRWLFSAAGAPLDADRAQIFNMRTEAAEAVPEAAEAVPDAAGGAALPPPQEVPEPESEPPVRGHVPSPAPESQLGLF